MSTAVESAVGAYEQACACDRRGDEADAIPLYERALELGLEKDLERGALLGLGSSLRNVGRLADSVAVLRTATAKYPEDNALWAFLALSLCSAQRDREAALCLLDLVLRQVPLHGYQRVLGEYAAALRAEPLPEVPASLRQLHGDPAEQAALQAVLEQAPGYHVRIQGTPARPVEGESLLADLPPGKSRDDKVVWGIYEGEQMVGVVDLVRGYPTSEVAYIGLFLLSERRQGRGLGSRAYAEVERRVRAWGGFARLRLSVARTNLQVLPFWHKLGFRETGEVKPFRAGTVESEGLLMEKHLT
jgi:ribosomal protein S18 acetylase RimI-like enzyme